MKRALVIFFTIWFFGACSPKSSSEGSLSSASEKEEGLSDSQSKNELASKLCAICGQQYQSCGVNVPSCINTVLGGLQSHSDSEVQSFFESTVSKRNCQSFEPEFKKEFPGISVCDSGNSSGGTSFVGMGPGGRGSRPSGGAGGKFDEEALKECLGDGDDPSLSRVLKFSGCRDGVVVEHIGLSDTGHNASSVIDYDGQSSGSHYMLSRLGVYDISPEERETGEDDGLDLDGSVTTFTLADSVIDTEGNEVSVDRTFIVHVPSDYDESMIYPVVFAWHGNGGTASAWKKGLADIIDEYQFVAIYPQGYADPDITDAQGNTVGASWNLGQEKSTADDFLFFKKILNEVSSLSPDASKRFSIGVSNGAALTNFLVTNSKEKLFSGIGTAVSGLISKDVEGAEDVTIEVSGETYSYGMDFLDGTELSFHVVAISGMMDTIITYCGGAQKTNYDMPSAEDSIRMYAKYLGCNNPDTEEVDLVNLSSGDRKDLEKTVD